MLFRPVTLRGIADGVVSVAFRRWHEPRVRSGGRQRTSIGVIAFDAVDAVAADELSDADAVAAGFASRNELMAFVDRRDGTIYRIRLRLIGPDPRIALREALPDDGQLREIRSAWIASIARAATGRGRDRCCAPSTTGPAFEPRTWRWTSAGSERPSSSTSASSRSWA